MYNGSPSSINQWSNPFDTCMCNRCPCCGKIIRPRLTSTWMSTSTAGGGNSCQVSSINDPKNSEIKSMVEDLISKGQLELS